MKTDGKCINVILIGNSGSGKSTLSKWIAKEYGCFVEDISSTSRKPRSGEVHGEHYYFEDKSSFSDEKYIEFEGFPDEHGEIQFYGTRLQPSVDAVSKGDGIIRVLEPNGAMKMKERLEKFFSDVECIYIYMNPPKEEIFENMLQAEIKDFTEKTNSSPDEEEIIFISRTVEKRMGRKDIDAQIMEIVLSQKIDLTIDTLKGDYLMQVDDLLGAAVEKLKNQKEKNMLISQEITMRNDCETAEFELQFTGHHP